MTTSMTETDHAPTLGQRNGYVCRDLLGVPREHSYIARLLQIVSIIFRVQ